MLYRQIQNVAGLDGLQQPCHLAASGGDKAGMRLREGRRIPVVVHPVVAKHGEHASRAHGLLGEACQLGIYRRGRHMITVLDYCHVLVHVHKRCVGIELNCVLTYLL